MISSVIARLSANVGSLASTMSQLTAHPLLEVGDLVDNRLLPITIDASTRFQMEDTTRWIQSLKNVEFVDVVLVHFEGEEELAENQNDNLA